MKLITQKAQTTPTQILLHDTEKFIKWHMPDVNFYLAGGAVMKAYNGEDLGSSDIDIFFPSNADFLKVSEYFDTIQKGSHHPNCIQYKFKFGDDSPYHQESIKKAGIIGRSDGKMKHRDHIPVQAIKGSFWKNLKDLFDHFDFTVCQMAYSRGEFTISEQAYYDNMNKVLSFSEGIRMEKFKKRRLLKYISRGYAPDYKVFETLFLDPDALYAGDFSDFNSNDSEDYDL